MMHGNSNIKLLLYIMGLYQILNLHKTEYEMTEF